VDASLLRLLRGVVPVPEVVEFRPAEGSLPPVLATRFCGGVQLDGLLDAGLTPDQYETLGINLGWVLGSLSSIPYLRPGMFADADLSLSTDGMPSDLTEWAQHFRDEGRLAAWQQRDWEALLHLVEEAQAVLDAAWQENPRVVLVHSDFNPKNILVEPSTGEVTGLLDWEYAHAGSPFTDLGNLLRFDRRPDFADAVLSTYSENVVDAPEDLLDRARAADMWALVDLAARRDENPVAVRAHDRLLAMARRGDLHATA
jgi:aminoglycoside phosphotransferase (APT) family kinase protein